MHYLVVLLVLPANKLARLSRAICFSLWTKVSPEYKHMHYLMVLLVLPADKLARLSRASFFLALAESKS